MTARNFALQDKDISFRSLERQIIKSYNQGRKILQDYDAAQKKHREMYVESAKLVSRLRHEIGLDFTCTTQDLMDKHPHLKSHILGSTGLVEREDDRAKS